MPGNQKERILVVESDPIIADLVAHQALDAAGYQTEVVSDTALAIPRTLQFLPDVIIVNLDMPGLSGKDLLTALKAQRIDTPAIVLARKGMEAAVIQAYRLGAADYLLYPLRETEVVAVVERVIRQVRERREAGRLARQLETANQELQNRMREMSTIFSLGKAVISITDHTVLFDRILEGAAQVAKASLGWFLLYQETAKALIMVAYQNLPDSLAAYLNETWDDGVSSLVAVSGQPLSLHGEGLSRLRIASLGKAALIVPVKVQKQVVGVLTLMRRQAQPFNDSDVRLVEAVADYASISLVNARLFRALEERANALQTRASAARVNEKVAAELLRSVPANLQAPLASAREILNRLLTDKSARFSPAQQSQLTDLEAQLSHLAQLLTSALQPFEDGSRGETNGICSLNDLVRQAVKRAKPFAQLNRQTILAEIPYEPVMVQTDASLIRHVLDGLLSNAIKFGEERQITVRLSQPSRQVAQVMVRDNGRGIESARLAHLFEEDASPPPALPPSPSFTAIRLPLMKEIIASQKGELWVESKLNKGAAFYFNLPALD